MEIKDYLYPIYYAEDGSKRIRHTFDRVIFDGEELDVQTLRNTDWDTLEFDSGDVGNYPNKYHLASKYKVKIYNLDETGFDAEGEGIVCQHGLVRTDILLGKPLK